MSSVKAGPIIKKRINGVLFNPHIITLLFSLLMSTSIDAIRVTDDDAKFDVNYKIGWGDSHITFTDDSREVQLSMDQSSGAGFESKMLYSSGYFSAHIKIPDKNSHGVVTTFYLSSQLDGQSPGLNHDELDFEFLGGPGPNYTLQTNVFSLDSGGREQRINLWFDPTKDFHTYAILWNQHLIIFYVDNTPVRVFKNNTSNGVSFPTKEMKVRASLWNGESWAGKGKIDWSQSPFLAHYRGLGLEACQVQNPREKCYDSNFWWNTDKFWYLDDKSEKEYQNVRINYLIYDYCWKGSAKHKECRYQL